MVFRPPQPQTPLWLNYSRQIFYTSLTLSHIPFHVWPPTELDPNSSQGCCATQMSHFIWKLPIGVTFSTRVDLPILQSKRSMPHGCVHIQLTYMTTHWGASGELDWEYQVVAGSEDMIRRALKAVLRIVYCCVALTRSSSVRWRQFKRTTQRSITTRSASQQIPTTWGSLFKSIAFQLWTCIQLSSFLWSASKESWKKQDEAEQQRKQIYKPVTSCVFAHIVYDCISNVFICCSPMHFPNKTNFCKFWTHGNSFVLL